MKHKLLASLALTLTLAFQAAQAVEPTRKDAIALADRAAAVVAKQGAPKLLSEVNAAKPEWSDKALYVIAYDLNGTVIGHPFNQKMIGKNVLEVPDIDGKFFRKDIIDGAKGAGSGWTDYKIRNPETSKVDHKATYYKRAGDVVLLVGIFADAK